MEQIIKNRIKLVTALFDAVTAFDSANSRIRSFFSHAYNLVDKIMKDNDTFLAVSTKVAGKVSYAKTKADIFNDNKRIATSLQKVVRRVYQIDSSTISDEALDFLVNTAFCYMIYDLDDEVKIIRGKAVTKAYADAVGSTSCMTGCCSSYKTSIYSENPDKVGLLVFKNTLRALIWNCDDGTIVVDRVYPSGHNLSYMLKKWITKKGYVYKVLFDTADTSGRTSELLDGKKHFITLKDIGVYPYFDTFKFAQVSKDKIVCCNEYNFGNGILAETNGNYIKRSICCECNKVLDSLVNIEGKAYCEKCYKKYYFACKYCRVYVKLENMAAEDCEMCSECIKIGAMYLKYNECTCSNCKTSKSSYVNHFGKEPNLILNKFGLIVASDMITVTVMDDNKNELAEPEFTMVEQSNTAEAQNNDASILNTDSQDDAII